MNIYYFRYDSSSSASYEVAKKTVGVYNYGYNAGYNKGYGLYNRGYGYTRYNKGYGLYNRGYRYNKYNRGYGYARRGFGHNKGYATKKTSGSYSVEYTNKYGMDKSASGSYEVTRSYPTYNRGYGYARRGYGYGRKNCKYNNSDVNIGRKSLMCSYRFLPTGTHFGAPTNLLVGCRIYDSLAFFFKQTGFSPIQHN